MTGGATGEAASEARGVRRIFLVALAAALVAAAVALGIALAGDESGGGGRPAAGGSPRPPLLPPTFHQPGFADTTLHLSQQVDAPPAVERRLLQVDAGAGAVVYVVARCDTGLVHVRAGAITSVQRCRHTPVGVIRLVVPQQGLAMDVNVDKPQDGPWAVAIYR
jgi:hypothetical protein